MPHVKQAQTFSVTEWPLAPSSISLYFNERTAVQKTGELLMFLADKLAAAKQPLHSKVVFTLLNVSTRGNRSYGFQPAPPENIAAKFPLSFTFALTANKTYTSKNPRFVRTMDMHSLIWGRKALTKNEFITIRLSPEQVSMYKLNDLSLKNLSYLYQIVGAFTKNFVRSPTWHRTKDFDVRGDWATFFTSRQPMTDMFKEKTFPEWAYNPLVWKTAPNLLVSQHFTPDLMLYWSLFLRTKPVYGTALTHLFGAEGKLTKFIADGVKEITSFRPVLSESGIAAVYLYTRVLDKSFDKSKADASAMRFVQDFKGRLQQLEQEHQFAKFNSDTLSIARQLIEGKVKNLEKQSWA